MMQKNILKTLFEQQKKTMSVSIDLFLQNWNTFESHMIKSFPF